MMGQQTIRYGIIGFGRFAEKAIAPAMRRAKYSALVALQKRSPDEARRKADQYNVPLAFGSVNELVRHPDIDAVFIVSANAAHCAETVLAAEAGKHVIVEKPMALSVAEAERMVNVCAQNNVRLMVGYMVRLSPVVRRIRELIVAGRIGIVTSARAEFMYDARLSQRSWLRNRTTAGGGPLYDVGVHCLDTLRYVLGEEPLSVSGAMWPPPTDVATEESAFLSLVFPSGVVGSIFCSYAAPVRRTFVEVIGTEGILSAREFTVSDHVGQLMYTPRSSEPTALTAAEDIVVPNLYAEEVSLFTDWILGGPEPSINGTNGLLNQRVLERVYTGVGRLGCA